MDVPEGFTWGTTASALSAGGAAPRADWSAWERSGRVPPSGAGNGFATAFADDLAQWAELGLTAHAPGLDWARLEPEERRPDQAAWEHARAVLTAARAAGVAVWPRLHDLTVPGWFADLGGFADDRARSYWWPRHVARCAEELGDLVAGWFPLWEPTPYAARAELVGTLAPGRHDPGRFRDLLGGMVLAWGEAWRELRGGPPVATALRIAGVEHRDPAPDAARRAVEADRYLWGTWVRALRDGLVDVPGRAVREVPALAGALDVVGVTWAGDLAVDRTGRLMPFPAPDPKVAHGQAPWPEGLGRALRRVDDDLPGHPVVLGLGIGTDDDDHRRTALHELLAAALDARADGLDLRGVWLRSAVDGYEGTDGFTVRYGLLDRARSPRDTALWLSDVIRTRRLDA